MPAIDPIALPGVALRPFGTLVDLELELGDRDRPGLVTALLAGCSDPGDAERWWAAPVGDRIRALLRVLTLTEAVDHVALSARCPDPSCGQLFEFELPLADLIHHAHEADPVRVALAGERAVVVRRPTGRDLQRWSRTRPDSRQAGVAAMLATLVQDGHATPEDEPALAETLAAMDPLVAFAVACRCPVCEVATEVPVDLEGLVLARLGGRQRALLREVHQLASRYGWTEAEVLAVAPARRARYLALIESER
jgi:hypothetical protein